MDSILSLVLAVVGCVSCHAALPAAPPQTAVSRPGVAPGEDASDPAEGSASWSVPFTVRGRLGDPTAVRWRVERGPGAQDTAVLDSAADAAGAAWSVLDGIGFVRANPGEAADVVISWQTPDSDPCGRFGRDGSVAHAGPMRADADTFVHLDASQRWRRDDRPDGERPDVALAHEFGHVLGLDHSPDPLALMASDTHRATPAPPDHAGVASLYGGGRDAPGDVVITGAGGARRAVLRGIAPPERTALALFDTDGDGDRELLVWRTDREGIGALVVYRFEPDGEAGDRGPRLARTSGPWLDVVPPGALSSLRTGADGRRWLLTREGDDLRVRGFDENGHLRVPEVAERIALDVEALLAAPGPEVCARAEGGLGAAHATDGAAARALEGDLDGDGRPDRVLRLPAP